jgi:hypothetical protein
MARVQFYYHEKGNHDEKWHYLCDVGGELHVETETSAGPGRGSGEITAPWRRSVEEFLEQDNSTAKDKLRALLRERGDPRG